MSDCSTSWISMGSCKISTEDWDLAKNLSCSDDKRLIWSRVNFRPPLCIWQEQCMWLPIGGRQGLLHFANSVVTWKNSYPGDPEILRKCPQNSVFTVLGNNIYITGGLNSEDKKTSSKKHYVLPHVKGALGRLMMLKDMKKEVYGHSSSVFGNNIYFCGGYDSKGQPSKTVQIYCTRLTVRDTTQNSVSGVTNVEDQWVWGTDMEVGKANLGTAFVGNYLYAMDQYSCERMSVFDQEWEVLPYDISIREQLSAKGDFVTSCCVTSGQLLVLFFPTKPSARFYRTIFDPTSYKWKHLEEVNFHEYPDKEDGAVIFSNLFSGQQLL